MGKLAINESGNVIFVNPASPANGQGSLAYFGTGTSWSLPVEFLMIANYSTAGGVTQIATTSSGNDVFLGSPDTFNSPGIQGGSVFRFERSGNNYIQTQQISANTPVNNGGFGRSIGCSGDGNYLTITSSNIGNSSSGVFVFSKVSNNYVQNQILTIANTDISGNIAINKTGNYFVVAVAGAGNSAFVFNRTGSNFALQQQLVASSGNLGIVNSVDINEYGNVIVLGTPRTQNGVSNDKGSAYIFARSGNTWTQQQIVYPTIQGNTDFFGNSVSINNSADQIMISCHGQNTFSGSAYIFNYSTISNSYYESVRISNPNPQNNSFFSLGLNQAKGANIAIIPAYGYDLGTNTNVGIAYIYGS